MYNVYSFSNKNVNRYNEVTVCPVNILHVALHATTNITTGSYWYMSNACVVSIDNAGVMFHANLI